MIILTFVAPLRPKLALTTIVVALVASLAIVEALTPSGRLDGEWLVVVRETSGYLFMSAWSVSDYSRAAVPLGLLALGWLAGTDSLLRRVCAGCLVTAAGGPLITFIFGDLLHVTLFIDLQSWRWLWLAEVVAFTLAPVIVSNCWARGASGRTAILLLASAWLFRGNPTALYLVAFSIACGMVPQTKGDHEYWRWVLFGAWVLAILALGNDLFDRLSYVPVEDLTAPALPQKLRRVCINGVIPGALIICAWLALRRSESTFRNAAIAAAAAVACGALVPLGWKSWTELHYTPELATRFAAWRAAIPANTEVLWPDTPVGAWYLLQRPNYWSAHQAAGAIFSKEKALLMRRRTRSILTAMTASHLAQPPKHKSSSDTVVIPLGTSKVDRAGMVAACADPDLQYIVSWLPVAPTPFAPVTVDPTKPNGRLFLYRCTDLRT
jgi:hypothetical protein